MLLFMYRISFPYSRKALGDSISGVPNQPAFNNPGLLPHSHTMFPSLPPSLRYPREDFVVAILFVYYRHHFQDILANEVRGQEVWVAMFVQSARQHRHNLRYLRQSVA